MDLNLLEADQDAAKIAAAQRDGHAFEALYLDYAQPVYRYLYSRVGQIVEAEELTAQTFLAALEKLPAYQHKGHFAAWLFSIARNKAADYFRGRGRQAFVEDVDDIRMELDLQKDVEDAESVRALQQQISALAEGERELLRLRYVADLSFNEIAILLKRKTDAVKKTLYRLLARLESQLEDSRD